MIKSYIYITGLMTAFLLTGWLTAFLIGLNHHWLFGIGFLAVFPVYITLVIRKRKLHKAKMEAIIHNYKSGTNQNPTSNTTDTEKKGWSMNNSPFRERKSGVTWGGGNIHAANASRNRRK